MVLDILDRHRGPYRLQAYRPFASKPGFWRSEWLSGSIDKFDVVEEATALLTDPRDTIDSVGVWSQSEQQFVTTIRPKDLV